MIGVNARQDLWTDPTGDAEVAIEAGADMLGFVFAPGHHDLLTRRRRSGSAIWSASRRSAFFAIELESIIAVRDLLGLDRVQLHGEEPDSWLETLGPDTLRRVRPDDVDPWRRPAMLAGRCLPLLDPGAGDGVAFNWDSLRRRPIGLWVGIAGGLDPQNVTGAIHAVRPALVDVSSGVEAAPGIKDPDLVAAFVVAARTAVESAPLDCDEDSPGSTRILWRVGRPLCPRDPDGAARRARARLSAGPARQGLRCATR